MAKTIATILGAGFLLVGICGFIAPGMLGMHLSLAHNLVHIISGAAALYFGLSGSLSAARLFCLVFGAVYLLLGVVGFVAGKAQAVTGDMPGMSPDDKLLKLLPGVLEFGKMDHIVHILLGLIFLIGGFLTKNYINNRADAD
ncbi:MAG TPA: DUF4383 domain-containing protein [Pyrinomonadaceae bacterium]|jgi:hypothetical protein